MKAISMNHQLRETRQHMRISIEELSKRSGISATHIRRIENYESDPTLTTMQRIAWGLRLDVWEVFGNKRE